MAKGTQDHGLEVHSAVDISGFSAVALTVAATAAQTAALPEGLYDVWCDVAIFIKVAAVANDVTAINGYLVRANTTKSVFVREGHKIGAIGSAGTMYYHKVG